MSWIQRLAEAKLCFECPFQFRCNIFQLHPRSFQLKFNAFLIAGKSLIESVASLKMSLEMSIKSSASNFFMCRSIFNYLGTWRTNWSCLGEIYAQRFRGSVCTKRGGVENIQIPAQILWLRLKKKKIPLIFHNSNHLVWIFLCTFYTFSFQQKIENYAHVLVLHSPQRGTRAASHP